jgi:Hint domain
VKGTRVRRERDELAIEELQIGDLVRTVSGELRPIKWIGRQSFVEPFTEGKEHVLPICFKADSLEDGTPRRDLWVSPEHAFYLDGVLIAARHLLNGISVVQARRAERIDYYIIELDSHDAVLTEGAFTETYADYNNRNRLHNVDEFWALYPNHQPVLRKSFAPRVFEESRNDHELWDIGVAVRRRIALRAWRQNAQCETGLGELRGSIDAIGPDGIAGWAQCVDYPEAPVCLEIYNNEELIAQVFADSYRRDLEQARIGSGRHGFDVPLPQGLLPTSVQVRRAIDGAPLAPVRPVTVRNPNGEAYAA